MLQNKKLLNVVLCAGLLGLPASAHAQIGGGLNVGGIGVEINIGPPANNTESAPSGAPLPLLGSTLIGNGLIAGAGVLAWRKRRKKAMSPRSTDE